MSLSCLEAIAARHRVVAVVRARPTSKSGLQLSDVRRRLGSLLRGAGLSRKGTLAFAARRAGARYAEMIGKADGPLQAVLADARPDLLCVAGFPWVLHPQVLSKPPLGAINVHAALLPRHRGPLPLFWSYHANDSHSGVTVHWMNERADAGAILLQDALPVGRGEPVEHLNGRIAEIAGPLLGRALQEIEAGKAQRVPQDESKATSAPWVRPGTPMIRFHEWDVERVWHFCAGVFPRWIEPLREVDGRIVAYRGVAGFSRDSSIAAVGRVSRTAVGWDLQCIGGCVHLLA